MNLQDILKHIVVGIADGSIHSNTADYIALIDTLELD